MNRRSLAASGLVALLALLALREYRSAGAAGERATGDGMAPVAAIAPGSAAAPAGARTAQADSQFENPRRNASPGKRDVFAPHSWAPPRPVVKPKPAPAAPPPPPPPPSAPALTLVFLGQLQVAGEATVYYLAQGDRVHAVSVGDTIDGVYRVLAPEGQALTLQYLPLNIKQSLPMRQSPS